MIFIMDNKGIARCFWSEGGKLYYRPFKKGVAGKVTQLSDRASPTNHTVIEAANGIVLCPATRGKLLQAIPDADGKWTASVV